MRTGSLLHIGLVIVTAAVFACGKDKEQTEAPGGDDAAPVASEGSGGANPARDCEGNCISEYSVLELGFGVDDGVVKKAEKACTSVHGDDPRCDSSTWQAGQHMATCQVCKKEVDVEGDEYKISLEYQEKFGYVYWVYRSPARDGMETIHWVGAHDGVYKGPWTLEAGKNP